MRHTFVVGDGVRLDVQPSRLEPGRVQVQVTKRLDTVVTLQIDKHLAAVIAQAFQIESLGRSLSDRRLPVAGAVADVGGLVLCAKCAEVSV
jgi:hypothetical protein